MAICTCEGVSFGVYSAAVSMKMADSKWVCIDVCIATEIGRLWMNGVTTINSCCGHGKLPPAVIVTDESVARMRELGYENDGAYPDREDIFLLTGKALPVLPDNPYYEAWNLELKKSP
jgi:hypothetical protein